MQTSETTTYQLRVYASEEAQLSFEADPRNGYTDGFMISFAEAVKGLSWPTGQTPQIYLSKSVSGNDYYTVDLTAGTPVFT